MQFLQIEKGSESEFRVIADKLFHDYAVQTKDNLYRLTEIEFYWNSPEHVDNSTYKRIHADPKTGEWFFHYSGVDIALRNEQNGGYGGILIRGLYDSSFSKMINGPMVCAMKLFSGNNAFSGLINTRIIEYKFSKEDIKAKPRLGLGENAKEGGANKYNYRFYIEPSAEKATLPKYI